METWNDFILHSKHAKTSSITHLSKQGERYQLQYTSVNPLETDTDIFIDARFSKKCMTYGRILEKYWF